MERLAADFEPLERRLDRIALVLGREHPTHRVEPRGRVERADHDRALELLAEVLEVLPDEGDDGSDLGVAETRREVERRGQVGRGELTLLEPVDLELLAQHGLDAALGRLAGRGTRGVEHLHAVVHEVLERALRARLAVPERLANRVDTRGVHLEILDVEHLRTFRRDQCGPLANVPPNLSREKDIREVVVGRSAIFLLFGYGGHSDVFSNVRRSRGEPPTHLDTVTGLDARPLVGISALGRCARAVETGTHQLSTGSPP